MGPLSAHFATGPQQVHYGSLLGQLNALDWVLLITVAVSTVLAFLRGLIRSLISLAGIATGIVLAAWYTAELASRLRAWIPQPAIAEIVAFLLILCGCYLIFAVFGRVLRGACKAVGLGFLDRLGGAAFGFARAVLLLSAMFIAAGPFFQQLSLVQGSFLLPYLRTAAHGISFVMPQDFADRLPAGAGSWNHTAPKARRSSARVVPESLPVPGNAEGDAQ